MAESCLLLLAWMPAFPFLHLIYPLIFSQTYFAILHPKAFAKSVSLPEKCMTSSHFFVLLNSLMLQNPTPFWSDPQPMQEVVLFFVCSCHTWFTFLYSTENIVLYPLVYIYVFITGLCSFSCLDWVIFILHHQCVVLCLAHNMPSLKGDWMNE